MNFLGLGPGELLLIMVLALVVFGPGKLPEIGAGLGRAIGEFRRATSQITEELNRELRLDTPLQEPRRAAAAVEEQSQGDASLASETNPVASFEMETPPAAEELAKPATEQEIRKLEAELEARRMAAVVEIKKLEAELEARRLAAEIEARKFQASLESQNQAPEAEPENPAPEPEKTTVEPAATADKVDGKVDAPMPN